MLKGLSTEETDKENGLLLNEDNLQAKEGETAWSCEELGFIHLMAQLSAKTIITYRNDMEEAHKPKHKESLSETIDDIWKR